MFGKFFNTKMTLNFSGTPILFCGTGVPFYFFRNKILCKSSVASVSRLDIGCVFRSVAKTVRINVNQCFFCPNGCCCELIALDVTVCVSTMEAASSRVSSKCCQVHRWLHAPSLEMSYRALVLNAGIRLTTNT